MKDPHYPKIWINRFWIIGSILYLYKLSFVIYFTDLIFKLSFYIQKRNAPSFMDQKQTVSYLRLFAMVTNVFAFKTKSVVKNARLLQKN